MAQELLNGFVHHGAGITKEGILGPIGELIGRGMNKTFPLRTPGIDAYINMHLKGFMPKDIFKEWTAMEGFDFSNYQLADLIFTKFERDKPLDLDQEEIRRKRPLSSLWLASELDAIRMEEILLWLQRGWITEDLANFMMKQLGIIDIEYRKLYLQMKDEFPTVQDLIQFSVRHGFEPDILSTFGYAKEIPKTYIEWANKIGLGGSSKVQIADATDSDGNPLPIHDASWAEQHWFAHWILPSLGDAYEMLHRLYLNSPFGASPDVSQDTDFDAEKLALFQRAQDIPQYWRARLQAISYSPFSRVDVRRMYNLRVIDEKEVYHSYRAQGYNDDKAQKLLTFAKKTREQQDIKTELWPKAEKICELRNLGLIDDGKAVDYTEKLGIPNQDIQDYFANCDLNTHLQRVKDALKYLKKGFIKGTIDEESIRSQLLDLGMTDEAIQRYIDDWTLEQQHDEKEANAREAQQWFEYGIISTDEFVERLQNLKISDGSILHMVEYSLVKITEKQAKNDAQLQKQLVAKAKELQKEQKAQAKEISKEQSDYLKRLLASSTQANLKKWWKDKLIPENLLNERLTLLNYSVDDIERWKKAYGG